MENNQTFEQYTTVIPWADILPIVIPGIIFTVIIVCFVWVGMKKDSKVDRIVAAIAATVICGMGIWFFTLTPFSAPNERNHYFTLEENLSQKYEFEDMTWEPNCGGRFCDPITTTKEQKVILKVDGTPQTYILTQDPDTNEPFLKDPFTGEEPLDIKK